MSFKVFLLPSAAGDFKRLDGGEKKLVAKQLLKLRDNPFGGAALGNKAGIDLTGYYKLYVDKKRLRIIHRVTGDDLKVEIIGVEVVVVGRRDDLEVYRQAYERILKERENIIHRRPKKT